MLITPYVTDLQGATIDSSTVHSCRCKNEDKRTCPGCDEIFCVFTKDYWETALCGETYCCKKCAYAANRQ
jgi:hypothetical protein